jgi:hypothetical protein
MAVGRPPETQEQSPPHIGSSLLYLGTPRLAPSPCSRISKVMWSDYRNSDRSRLALGLSMNVLANYTTVIFTNAVSKYDIRLTNAGWPLCIVRLEPGRHSKFIFQQRQSMRDTQALKGVVLSVLWTSFLISSHAMLAQDSVSFAAHRDFVAGDGPKQFASGDLNHDGITDLIVPNSTVNFALVSVLLGKSDGTFQPERTFATGGFGTVAAIIADFNGDGNQDVAVATMSGVSVLLGDGTGNLGVPKNVVDASLPEALVAADFNEDGKIDVAAANFISNTVSILLGDGKGNLVRGANLTVGRAPLGIAVGDLNHDGHQDLAVANSNQGGGNPGPNGNTVSILRGTGKGTFQTAINVAVAKGPIGITIADPNKDNNPDVVVTNSLTDQVSLLLGNGDGTFQSPATFSVASGGTPVQGFFPSYVSVTDLNGDGNLDLLVANTNTSTIALLTGDGRGHFAAPLNLSVGRTPVAVLAGDFNGDGKPDFVTSNQDGHTISVVLGTGNGKLLDVSTIRASAGPVQILSADFNRDGISDLATANAGNSQDGSTVSVFLGKHGGGFSPQLILKVGTDPLSLVTADFNNDGLTDIVAANFGKFPNDHGNVSLLLNSGNGTFKPALNFAAGDFPDFIAAADFNDDGNQDLVVADFGTNVGVAGISVLFGDGKGGFARPVKVGPALDFAFQVLAGDFDGDGNSDIAYSSSGFNDSVSVLLGDGKGNFFPAKTVTSSLFLFTFTTGDFNHDGITDFAVEEGGLIEILIGTGQGNYRSVGFFDEGEAALFSAVQSLAVGDFNKDGFLDLAAPDVFSDNVSILLGNGDGTFQPGQLFAGAPGGRAVVADFNQDGRSDIALAATDTRTNQGKVVLLLNRTR